MPDTIYLRTSERGSYKRCRWQWDQAFNARIKPHVPGHALRFGDLVHRSLAAYYKPGVKRGPRPWLTFAKLYAKELETAERMGFRDEDGKWNDAATLGEAMLKGYHDLYHDADSRYRVIASEATFRWRIRDPQTKRVLCVYVGTFDGVWEDLTDNMLIFPEHKTTGKMAKNWDHLEMDEQASAYWTYGPPWLRREGLITADDPQRFKGILYNFLRKALPDDRPQNADGLYLNQPTAKELREFGEDYPGSVSKNQPSPLFMRPPMVYRDESHRRRQHQRVIDEAREMAMVRGGELPVIKNPGPLYMPNCAGCPYRDMCTLHEMGADWEAMRDATMSEWNPYEAHDLDPHGDIIA